MTQIPAFLPYLLGGLVIPFLPAGAVRSAFGVSIALVVGLIILTIPEGTYGALSFMGLDLTLMRVDQFARIFGIVFSLAACFAMIYAWHLRDWMQQAATLLYVGSAIGAVFAGDLITLFFFWEGTAIASVFLIWARRTEGAYHAAMRYLIMQIGSGVILIAGVALLYRATGSIGFEVLELAMQPIATWGAQELAVWMILIAFGIKAAFPLLNGWLTDAYASATVTGSVVLSSFTTKLAVYALARTFPGTEILIYIGIIMALVPLIYAVFEDDLRRLLAHALNIQLGFMVVGVGVGSELALNGVAAHAFAHILYKSLLFMGVGAVLFRTGTARASELGGLYRTMPITMILTVIAALSISFPLFAGFVAKSLILSATVKAHYEVIWGLLVFSSAAVFVLSGFKIPYVIFFGQDSKKRPAEAPTHMLIAMGFTAAICVVIGLVPSLLYNALPFDVKYDPYTLTHVVTQLQLLGFAVLAFLLAERAKLYPTAKRAVALEVDWIYRVFFASILRYAIWVIAALFSLCQTYVERLIGAIMDRLHHSHGPDGSRAASWPSGAMVLSISALLALVLFVIFFS